MGEAAAVVLAVSTGVAVLYGVALFAILLIPPVITALKGRWGYFSLGFVLFGTIWLVAMWLPAEPDSWWERHRGLG